MADGTEKPIDQIVPGDMVLAFGSSGHEDRGALMPRRVVRKFTNVSQQIIDLHDLQCTPGHLFLTGESISSKKDDFATIAHILQTDGTIVDINGSKIRARTGVVAGSQYDMLIRVAYVPENTTAEQFALVRCGIPVSYTDKNNKINKVPLFEYLKSNKIDLLNDGRIMNSDGTVYDAVDWPAGITPFSNQETQNWVVSVSDAENYTPPWIGELADITEYAA